MLLSPQPYRLSNQGELFPIKLNENVIFEVNEFKFLSLHLANNSEWRTHINFIGNKLLAWELFIEREIVSILNVYYLYFIPLHSHI